MLRRDVCPDWALVCQFWLKWPPLRRVPRGGWSRWATSGNARTTSRLSRSTDTAQRTMSFTRKRTLPVSMRNPRGRREADTPSNDRFLGTPGLNARLPTRRGRSRRRRVRRNAARARQLCAAASRGLTGGADAPWPRFLHHCRRVESWRTPRPISWCCRSTDSANGSRRKAGHFCSNFASSSKP